MARTVTAGFRMVLVPGAVAYPRHLGNPAPIPTEIHELLDRLGFPKDVDRTPDSILAAIGVRLEDRYRGLIPDRGAAPGESG